MPPGRPEVLLVLGGGGVRGLAHLGVLKALEEQEVPVDGIVGTSSGAVVGALYAREPDANRLIERVLEFLKGSAFRRLNLRFDQDSSISKSGRPSLAEHHLHGLRRQLAMEALFRRRSIFSGDILRRLVGALVGDGRIEETRIPLHVMALDLVHGRELVLSEGDLRASVVASASVPGYFPPVALNGTLACDAGLVSNMPVTAARDLGGECVLAVSLSREIDPLMEFPTGIDVIFRSEEIGTRLVDDQRKRAADVVLEPNMRGRYWLDFDDPEAVIRAGEAAAREKMPEILEAVGRGELVHGSGMTRRNPPSS
ncbi:MAG: patatin-like phospholipase family protein [Planctomycetota bacterium]